MTDTHKAVGRPKVYASEEDRIKARRERANARYAAKSDEEKAAVAARSKAFRENNPDKVAEYRANTYASHRQRYENDPEYRKSWNLQQKELRAARAANTDKEKP